jgi:hypothetical protein
MCVAYVINRATGNHRWRGPVLLACIALSGLYWMHELGFDKHQPSYAETHPFTPIPSHLRWLSSPP